MKNRLHELKPQTVFKHFDTLTRIPRGSGNEKEVSDYLVKFAKDLNLEVIQDDFLNVIIKKPGTKGYENSKTVILQGHMDMVCVKRDGMDFDFEKDPIPILVEEDMIKTEGTTLGADNGIAVAMAMAILESKDLEHPPLTALITVSEETGMLGVLNLKEGLVKGDVLINLDSEEEGVFLASCAGALRNRIQLPIEYKKANEDIEAYKVTITGLLGGHSGMEIGKKRASAINLMGRLLDGLNEEIGIDLLDINGGEKLNAIPKIGNVTILFNKTRFDDFNMVVKQYNQMFLNEYHTSDPNIKIDFKMVEKPNQVLCDATKEKIISTLRLLPYGVQKMSANIDGLVESSNNVGLIETKENYIEIGNAIRSSIGTSKYEINNRIKHITRLINTSLEIVSDYPEWQYQVQSPIRELMLKVYKDMYHKEAEVQAIHAGLECGFLKEKLGDIDMISIGPNIYDVHTPQEKISISSTKRVYEFLCGVLRNLN